MLKRSLSIAIIWNTLYLILTHSKLLHICGHNVCNTQTSPSSFLSPKDMWWRGKKWQQNSLSVWFFFSLFTSKPSEFFASLFLLGCLKVRERKAKTQLSLLSLVMPLPHCEIGLEEEPQDCGREQAVGRGEAELLFFFFFCIMLHTVCLLLIPGILSSTSNCPVG